MIDEAFVQGSLKEKEWDKLFEGIKRRWKSQESYKECGPADACLLKEQLLEAPEEQFNVEEEVFIEEGRMGAIDRAEDFLKEDLIVIKNTEIREELEKLEAEEVEEAFLLERKRERIEELYEELFKSISKDKEFILKACSKIQNASKKE